MRLKGNFQSAFFLFASVLISTLSYGQSCGTVVTPASLQAQQSFMPGYFGCEQINTLNREFQMTVHIVEDSLGNTGYDESQLEDALALLNEMFSPIGFSFRICEVRRIEDFQFQDYRSAEDRENLLGMYYQVNTINVYLVNSIIADSGIEAAGLGTFPGGSDTVWITKETMNGQVYTLPHEMGHFFGLYHTFETEVGGPELVDGSNCETAGDLVCDTEASPTDDPDDFEDCNYIGNPATDSNGDFYVPPANNIMSYVPAECRCRFTPQQYNRMIEQYLQFRTNLW